MALSGSLEAIAIALAIYFCSIAFAGGTQYVRLLKASKNLQPWNIQKGIQIVITLGAQARALFFITAILVWNEDTGMIDEETQTGGRLAFWAADRAAACAALSAQALLALFAAEVYCTAVGRDRLLARVLRPLVSLSNLVVYALAALFVMLYSTVFNGTGGGGDYLDRPSAALWAAGAPAAAAAAALAGARAAGALARVPVAAGLRRAKARQIFALVTVTSSAMVIRAVIIIFLADRAIFLSNSAERWGAPAYFALLEGAPAAALLAFTRRRPAPAAAPAAAAAGGAEEGREARGEEGVACARGPALAAGEGTALLGGGKGAAAAAAVPGVPAERPDVEASLRYLHRNYHATAAAAGAASGRAAGPPPLLPGAAASSK